jgi:nitrile hydratase accessory protein
MRPDDLDPVFREPWEARAFAIVLELHARGVFTSEEWSQALATQIARAQKSGDADLGDTYYNHWLAALEAIVAMKGVTSPDELMRYRSAWDNAAGRTLHGQSIELEQRDFSGLR